MLRRLKNTYRVPGTIKIRELRVIFNEYFRGGFFFFALTAATTINGARIILLMDRLKYQLQIRCKKIISRVFIFELFST